MKKIFLMITLFLIVSSSLIYALNIIECYNAIPEQLLEGNKINLIVKNNKWFYGDDSSQSVEAVVDMENYYLELHFGGAGRGLSHEIAVFLTKFGYSIVAINLIHYSQIPTRDTTTWEKTAWSDLKFYKYDNWQDITDDIFPLTDLAPFFDSTYFREIYAKINHPEYIYSIKYKLPRHGIKIIAYLYPSDTDDMEADAY